MKHLLLLAVFALVASPAFAQNVADVDQTGNGHDATVVQSNSSNADVDQRSSGGTVGNTVLLTQSASSATIDQTGNGNRVQGVTAGTNATQSGGSSVMVTQSSVPDASAFPGNNAVVEQTLGATGFIDQNSTTGPGSEARLRQDGASTGTINQTNIGARHSGYIYQIGDGNNSTIDQFGGAGSNTYLLTVGDDNVYSSTQDGTSHIVDGRAFGDGNDLTINQDGPFSGQLTVITTTGDDNRANITQSVGTMDGGAATWNEVRMSVAGDLNQADILQTGEDNQVGSAADAFDQNGDGNILDVEQTGSFNLMLGSQADGSTATVDQTGASNEIRLDQNDATATMMQNGDNNQVQGVGGAGTFGIQTNGSTLNLDQMGNANVLSLDQNNGATANVMQDGLTNTAEIVQN